jgi:uncharacterized protein (TIGR03067 family)
MLRVEAKGERFNPLNPRRQDTAVNGDKVTRGPDSPEPMTGTLKIDLSQRPKTIDITWADGVFKGRTFKGIYLINGDVLKICWDSSEMGEGRPEDFTTQDNPEYELSVWRKKQP